MHSYFSHSLHGRQNEPAGPLIVAICRDMHSIISLIKAVHPTQHGAVEKPKYVSLASVSGEIHIPQGLRIPQKDMSKKFENTENQYLSECVIVFYLYLLNRNIKILTIL